MSMNIENQICEPRTNHGTAEQRENNEQIVSRIQAGEKEQENMTLLWQQNQNFIAMIARKYSSCAEMEDLEQEGYIGLYEAVKHYDTSSEVPFINYAAFWIRQVMRRYIDNCGRVVRIPTMGKVMFCDLQDAAGRIQIYLKIDEMDEATFERCRKLDIGDIVGVHGEVFRTQRGEISVRAHEVVLLAKALLPLPDKFHGLTNLETRYRQRYVATASRSSPPQHKHKNTAFSVCFFPKKRYFYLLILLLNRFLSRSPRRPLHWYRPYDTPLLSTLPGPH